METPASSATKSDTTADASTEQIGRYLRTELEAMHGKRGRKPPEYFILFPERMRTKPESSAEPVASPDQMKAPSKTRRAKLAEVSSAGLDGSPGYEADPLAVRVRHASPAVRKLITNLLDVVAAAAVSAPGHDASPGKHGAAEITAGSAAASAMASANDSTAPDSTTTDEAPAPSHAAHLIVAVTFNEPVYADPEADAELVEQG